MKNRILQLGSGSMGNRRMRDLAARGDVELGLFEQKEERRNAAREKFGVACFPTIEDALAWNPDTFVISTPPHLHAPYVEMALQHGKNFFCEADIWPYNYREIERAAAQKSLVPVPSCTLYFLPVLQEVRRIVQEELGSLHAYQMCLSVNAAGWHPHEGKEYYARHRSTVPAREMVPFELTGLVSIFGTPVEVTGTVRRRGDMEFETEDTWCLQMTLDNGATGQLAVFMASPQIFRTGVAIGSNGIVTFDLLSGDITRHLPILGLDDRRNFGAIKDVIEPVYKTEIDAFIQTIRGEGAWPHSYAVSSLLSGALAAAEKSALTGRAEKVDPHCLPAQFPDSYELN